MTFAPERPAMADDACDCPQLDLFGMCACTAAEPVTRNRRAELYLGTHERHWLHDPRFEERLKGLTIFVSRVRLAERKSDFPPALHPYCIDSGGFSELQKHGRWTITAAQYVAEIRRYLDQLGPDLCRWVAPMDHMCEKIVIQGGTASRGVRFHGTRELRGLQPGEPEQDLTAAVRIHQRLTVDNLLELRALAPEIPFIAVLQGDRLEDYIACEQMYAAAGIDLATEPVVGLGSVCRRQATSEIEEIVSHFHAKGYRLHGFGVKTRGLERYANKLISADSLAWSDVARQEVIQLAGHTHQNCANCADWAIQWHSKIATTVLAAA